MLILTIQNYTVFFGRYLYNFAFILYFHNRERNNHTSTMGNRMERNGTL